MGSNELGNWLVLVSRPPCCGFEAVSSQTRKPNRHYHSVKSGDLGGLGASAGVRQHGSGFWRLYLETGSQCVPHTDFDLKLEVGPLPQPLEC